MEFSHIISEKNVLLAQKRASPDLCGLRTSFFTEKSPFVLVYPPKPKNYVIWIHAVSDVPLCSSSNFPHLKRCWGHDLFWPVLIIKAILMRNITGQRKSMHGLHRTPLSLCLRVIMNKKTLNLEKSTSSVLSVLLLIYAIN